MKDQRLKMHLYPEYRHLQTKTIAEIGKEGLSTEDTLHTTAVEVIANNGQTDNSEAGSQGESEQPDRRERGAVSWAGWDDLFVVC